jgi:hypothetical protein
MSYFRNITNLRLHRNFVIIGQHQELFQVKIDPTEVLKEYYSLQQQVGESVAEFLLRFRAI